jgi:acyl-CoA reductase-like NAD-dependent aldehyde dehydrogenase
MLNRLAAIMRERSEELVLLESIDAGKPLADDTADGSACSH